jgi:hypothetical protein
VQGTTATGDHIEELLDENGDTYFYNPQTEQSGWTRNDVADAGSIRADEGSAAEEAGYQGEEWYYINADGYQGPVSSEQLIELHREKLISKATYVWAEGVADWLPYAYSGAGMEDVEVAYVDEAAKSEKPPSHFETHTSTIHKKCA